MSMIIAVNAGSSSLKFQLYKMPGYQGNYSRSS